MFTWDNRFSSFRVLSTRVGSYCIVLLDYPSCIFLTYSVSVTKLFLKPLSIQLVYKAPCHDIFISANGLLPYLVPYLVLYLSFPISHFLSILGHCKGLVWLLEVNV